MPTVDETRQRLVNRKRELEISINNIDNILASLEALIVDDAKGARLLRVNNIKASATQAGVDLSDWDGDTQGVVEMGA